MTQQDKAAPQAAGAVSIDSPEYLNLLADLRRANTQAWVNTAEAVLTQHIDAHAAQRYEAGRAEQIELFKKCAESDQAEFNRKWAEQKARADRSEASLARLVEVTQKLNSIGMTLAAKLTMLGDKEINGVDYLTRDSVMDAVVAWRCSWDDYSKQYRALLPAKAATHSQFGSTELQQMIVARAVEKDTPAPAMGEELPPLPMCFGMIDIYGAGGVTSVEGWTADQVRGYAIDYGTHLALRPPGAAKVSRLSISHDLEFMSALDRYMDAVTNDERNTDRRVACRLAIFSAADAWKARSATAPVSQPAAQEPFQYRVQPWMLACFGEEISGDKAERNHRFFEESTELVQACGMTASDAHQLVDYVYGRDIGEPQQEVGGVMVTMAALCLAQSMDMHQCGETELTRIWTKVEQIRAKQAAKPKHSPLPAAPQPITAPAGSEQEEGAA